MSRSARGAERRMPEQDVLAIDPGNEESALLHWRNGQIVHFEHSPNEQILALLRANWPNAPLVIEQIKSYGMAVGQSVFDTCVWIGRFWEAYTGQKVVLVPRKTMVTHHCNNPRGNDSNVRQAIVDRFGGKEKAIGKKSNPGPLHGVSGDCWSALAIALWYVDNS